MKHTEIEEEEEVEEECCTSRLEMAHVMAQLILPAMLIFLNSAAAIPLYTEYTSTDDAPEGMKSFVFSFISYI